MNEQQVLQPVELNRYVNRLLQDDWLTHSLRLRGEISGFKAYPSGHWYFTVKDSEGAVDCVMWRSSAMRMSFRPQNGDRVIMHGTVKVYEVTGRFQFVADSMRPEGVGDLYRQFELLKQKLQDEGLFDQERKRPLPMRPRRIAVITSQAGAVLHDIRHVSAARDPGIPLVLLPVPVQGPGAGEQIAEAVRIAPSLPDVDVIIVGRGGGSMEDLWCFNDEALARAIAACPVPVISAVGHETDFTICDFVADVRAATPSNAAELAVPDREELLDAMELMRRRFDRAADATVQSCRLALKERHTRLMAVSPVMRIQALRGRSVQLRLRLNEQIRNRLNELRPRVAMAAIRLDNGTDSIMERGRQQLRQLRTRLTAVSPDKVLERGYALVTGPDGLVTDAARAPEHMTLRFHDGQVAVTRDKGEEHGKD